MVYQETFSEDLTITNRERTEQPQISIKAKVRKDTFLSDIFLGLDAGFTRHGAVRIEINDVPFFESQEPNSFRRYQTFPVGTNNKILRNGESVKIWAWSLNGSTLNLTATVSISEERFEAGKNPDAINELLVARLLSDNPEVSSDTSVIVDGLQAVQDALNTLDIDLEDGSVVTALTDILNNLPTNPDNAGIIAALNMVIDNLPDSPDNADIIQALEDLERALPPDTDSGVINAVRDLEETIMNQVVNLNDTSIVNSITALQAALPESPDNAQTHADLEAILAGLPDSPSNADVVAALTALQTSLPEDLHDDLDAIVNSINNQTSDLTLPADDDLTLTSTRDEIMLVLTNSTGAYRIALQEIVDTLDLAEADFNQNTLDNLIAAISSNLTVIQENNIVLHRRLTAALNRLNQIHQTVPLLRTSDETSLFPRELYTDESHTALLNLLGSKNMIIIINAENNDGFGEIFSTPRQDAPHGSFTPSSSPSVNRSHRHIFDLLDSTTSKQIRLAAIPHPDSREDVRGEYLRPTGGIDPTQSRTTNGYANNCTLCVGGRRNFGQAQQQLGITRAFTYGISNTPPATDGTFPPNTTTVLGSNLTIDEIREIDQATTARYFIVQENITYDPQVNYFGRHQTEAVCHTDDPSCPETTDAFIIARTDVLETAIHLSDTNREGGSIELSAEVRDSNNAWHTYITPQEFARKAPEGSPTLLTSPGSLTIQFGELLNAKVLPSSASLFRLRLKITGAAMVSVDIIRVV